MFDEDDIEELFAKARASRPPRTREQNWKNSSEIAYEVLRLLPSARVGTGASPYELDYIPPAPHPPIIITAADGRFIVRFDEDGSWLEADGQRSSVDGIIEGNPQSVAEMLIRSAGVESETRPPHARWHRELPKGPRRLLHPQSTNTWRDHVYLPEGQAWDGRTPASICRESQASRLFMASYEQASCTYAGSLGPSDSRRGRWGVESLRISVPNTRYSDDADLPRVGDVLATVGEKFDGAEDQLDFDDGYEGVRLWHPQRIVQVVPEGFRHLRVWLARDDDVANENLTLDEIPEQLASRIRGTTRLQPHHAQVLYAQFQLNVFCDECGNRGKPIVYGMPGPEEPEYLALGGCLIEPNQPRYVCLCGHEWTDLTGDEK